MSRFLKLFTDDLSLDRVFIPAIDDPLVIEKLSTIKSRS